ncbi:MAG: glycine/D-amino acid oxidase-like deaminating enzyme [Gammaproteobacteria bacterium]|jgi:glycine/D-amino acid oxidase-like deaminating enzyme
MSVTDSCGWIKLKGKWKQYPKFKNSQVADWVIIGAGFTGIAAARRIVELDPGKRVLLIDGKQPGQGASARNSGFVVAYESSGHAQIHTKAGREGYIARHTIDRAGVAEVEKQITDYQIDCDWSRTGSIHAAADPKNFESIRRHHQGFSDLGIESSLLDHPQLESRLGTSHYGLGVYCEGGALVQPAALVKGLLESLPEQVEVYAESPVLGIEPATGSKVRIKLAEAEVIADRVIVAVNAFLPRLGLQANRVFPLALTASLTRRLNPDEMLAMSGVEPWGILSPQPLGATLRYTADNRLLIRNTAEFLPGIDPNQLQQRRNLHQAGLQKRFPWLGKDCIETSWSGQICVSRNSRPVFGELQKNVFASGCYNASGIAKGNIMGKLIAEYALGSSSELLDLTRSIATPAWIPPRWIFAPLARVRMASDRSKGLSET